ncbi:MAG: heavy metal-responsive transcriptional regulator [bacterium]
MKLEWRIGALARAHGLNPKTIRYYEALGILPVPARNPAGYRIYGQADRERLAFIGKAKAIGLTLADIRDVLTLYNAGAQPCGHVVALLDQKLASIDAQLDALTAFRQQLMTLRAGASTSETADCICGIIEQKIAIRAPRILTEKQPPNRSLTPQR